MGVGWKAMSAEARDVHTRSEFTPERRYRCQNGAWDRGSDKAASGGHTV